MPFLASKNQILVCFQISNRMIPKIFVTEDSQNCSQELDEIASDTTDVDSEMEVSKPEIQNGHDPELVKIQLENEERANKIPVESEETKLAIVEESSLVEPKIYYNQPQNESDESEPDLIQENSVQPQSDLDLDKEDNFIQQAPIQPKSYLDLTQNESDESEPDLIQENSVLPESELDQVKEDNLIQQTPIQPKPDLNLTQTDVTESEPDFIQENQDLPETDLDQVKENKDELSFTPTQTKIEENEPETPTEAQTHTSLDQTEEDDLNETPPDIDPNVEEAKLDGLDEDITVEHETNLGSEHIRSDDFRNDSPVELELGQNVSQIKEDETEQDLTREIPEPESNRIADHDQENMVKPEPDLNPTQISPVESEPHHKEDTPETLKSSPALSEENVVLIPIENSKEQSGETEVETEVEPEVKTEVNPETDRVGDATVSEARKVTDVVDNSPEPDPSEAKDAATDPETVKPKKLVKEETASTYDPRKKDRQTNCIVSALVNIVDFFF